MKFSLSFWNLLYPGATPDSWFAYVSIMSDMARLLRLALEQAGHRVVVNNEHLDESGINLFIEKISSAATAIELHRRGYRYGLICTEPLDVWGEYNRFEFDQEVSRSAWNAFAASAENADFIWYLIESAGPVCKRLNPNSHFLRLGCVSGYEETIAPVDREFEIDFFISGRPSDRRRIIAEELHRRGFRVTITSFEPDVVRRSMLERSRATLSIQKSDRHSIFSYGRVAHAVMNRVPAIVEYGEPTYLSPYCVTASADRYIEACIGFARDADFVAYVQEAYDRFARELPMTEIMAQVLEASGF